MSHNKDLKKKLQEYEIPKREFFSFETSEGLKLNAWMMKPLNFDENKEYPALLHFYGGPGSQKVLVQHNKSSTCICTPIAIMAFMVDKPGCICLPKW
jgi:dipeptidyl-peptidase-4